MLQKEINYEGGVLAVPVRITNWTTVSNASMAMPTASPCPKAGPLAGHCRPGDDGSEQLFGVSASPPVVLFY